MFLIFLIVQVHFVARDVQFKSNFIIHLLGPLSICLDHTLCWSSVYPFGTLSASRKEAFRDPEGRFIGMNFLKLSYLRKIRSRVFIEIYRLVMLTVDLATMLA